jgi:hypothetical protein
MVASRVALDLPYWAMRSASYRLIPMAIEIVDSGQKFAEIPSVHEARKNIDGHDLAH